MALNEDLIEVLKTGITEIKVKSSNDKKVKVTCTDKDTGEDVYFAIVENQSDLMASSFEKSEKGANYKDFTFKFGSKEEAKYFKDMVNIYRNAKYEEDEEELESSDTDVDLPTDTEPKYIQFLKDKLGDNWLVIVGLVIVGFVMLIYIKNK